MLRQGLWGGGGGCREDARPVPPLGPHNAGPVGQARSVLVGGRGRGILAPSLPHAPLKRSKQNPTPQPVLEQQVKTQIPDNTKKVGGCHRLPATSGRSRE